MQETPLWNIEANIKKMVSFCLNKKSLKVAACVCVICALTHSNSHSESVAATHYAAGDKTGFFCGGIGKFIAIDDTEMYLSQPNVL